jgi:hypothetical protein
VSHADEVITDVNRRRVVARADGDRFTIAWDYPGRTLLEVRILRSEQGPAGTPGDGPDHGQELVYQDVSGSFRDDPSEAGRAYCYTVFARHPGGEWVRWGEYPPPREARRGWRGFTRLVQRGLRMRVAPVVLALLCGVALAAAPGAAVAAGDEASGGDDQPAAAEEPAVSAAESAARAFVEADASIAGILAGRDADVAVMPWGGTQAEPAGFTFTFRWTAAKAVAIGGEWPLLRSGTSTPATPYDSTLYRLRASDVSALRVDVLAAGPELLQVMPVNGETDLLLEEQTWSPFRWFPWFTERPWVLAPVFLALTALLMARAWRRSRAWNRRLPSMTRHDRQFIGRVAILLFLIAGFAWQFYEGWFAAAGPSVGSSGSSAGDLASLPLLLIPPGLFVAGLVLELSAGPRRGSWGLLGVLSAAACVFYLAAALTGTVTNLNLSYYILLAVLTLICIPRAFSAGKMGWSRGNAPHYG